MPEEIHVVCTEQKRLTEVETTLKFLIKDTLPRMESKLDKISNTLENGLKDEIKSISNKLDNHLAKHERTVDEKGEPIERRADPPPKPEAYIEKFKKKSWLVKIPIIISITIFLFGSFTAFLDKFIVLLENLQKFLS